MTEENDGTEAHLPFTGVVLLDLTLAAPVPRVCGTSRIGAPT
jgi:hypothetical protein